MFFGHIAKVEPNRYPKAIQQALNYLKHTDFDSLPAGRYPLQGDSYVQVLDLQTQPKSAYLPEVHRKYLDVQYWHKGSERMAVAPDLGNNPVAEEYSTEKDIMFYQSIPNEQEILCQAGNFAVFFPEDAHRGACAENETGLIRKIVVKVAVSEL
ncbi:YhcH/YjgK/YiaL family protein [Lonepinella sp. MS14437]|uniref:YhcH/YjgK/YiaL family protein n=1 Tax=Lonepinella sp. MS14437 TaxID=3003620 RepID=UPI0036DF692C